jgi:DNA transformation protein
VASQRSTIDFLLEQTSRAGHVSARRMFGEFAVYCDGKVVGFVCDDQLFIKPIAEARAYLGEVTEAPPYPGAKLYFLVSGDQWEDSAWMSDLFRTVAAALPIPVPKRPKIARTKKVALPA